MKNTQCNKLKIISDYVVVKNKPEIFIFITLFVIALSITIYQFSVWESSSERIAWKSFALFSGDEPSYLEITSTIINHHSLNIDYFYKDPHPDPMLIEPSMYYEVDTCRLHHALLGRDGHCWSSHQPGLPFLLVPGYAIGGAVGAMVSMNMMFTLQGIIIFKFLKKFVKKSTSLVCTLIFSLVTISLSFSDRIYPDFIAGFFIFSALYFFFVRENNFKNLMAAGLLLGFLPFLKTEFAVFSILLLPIMIISMLKRRNYEGPIILVSSFLLFTLIFMWYLVISSPVEESPGFGGTYTHLAQDTLSTKIGVLEEFLSKGFANLLFGRSYGLFVFSPLALLSLFGMKYVWNYNKVLTTTIVIVMSLFILGLSMTIPYAAGWTLPSRYLLPILPLTVIPFAFLFENLIRKIPFQIILLATSFIGTSLNILFARIIYSHTTVEMRANIANQAYLGAAQIFPYVGVSTDPLAISNFWSSSGPFFWIFLVTVISLFCIFTLYSKIKTYVSTLKRNNKIILFSIAFAFLTPCIIYAYEVVNEYVVQIQIVDLYHKILGRSPDSEGLSHWKNVVLHEGKSLDWVEEMMYKSPEGVATTKVTSFYNDILHRSPDPDGLSHWKDAILVDGKSYDWVEEMIKNSPEAQKLTEMKTRSLILFGIYVVVFVILVTSVTIPNQNLKLITRTTFEKTVNVDQKQLFNLMADVEKYPEILPENIVSVQVINHTDNVMFVKEIVQEDGIKTELMVKHIIIPYKQHIAEVLNGDANGTRITVNFNETGSQTKIDSSLELHLKGILLPFAYLPSDNIQHAMNTVLDHFVNYLR